MVQTSSSEQLADVMARTRRQWQARRKTEAEAGIPVARAPAAFTIAISREAGANGHAVAQAVGERLGWVVYDRELLQRVAGEMQLRVSLLEGVDEKRKAWLQECLEALSSGRAVSQVAYVRYLVETLLALAAHGECVIVGRGAAQVLPAATTLRVRLVSPAGERIAVIRQRLGMTDGEAARWVGQTDGDRGRFVMDHFHRDPADPHDYDLVLNSARLGIPDCADLIVEGLRRLQARAPARTPEPLVT
jgi:cytidylate kinase